MIWNRVRTSTGDNTYARRTELSEQGVVYEPSAYREEEKQYVAERDATVQEDSWESVAKMVNLKEVAGADTTRMRNVLIGLKHK